MKRKTIAVLIITIFSFVLFLGASTADMTRSNGKHKYVGVSKCSMCHKDVSKGRQYEIWRESKHADAMNILDSPESDMIAKDKGYTTKAIETPQCVRCHLLGVDVNPDELADTFDKTEGVQCESCHGPGSDYKTLSIMSDRQKAIDNGLIFVSPIEKFCTNCHNSESPFYKEFNFEKNWAQIKHYKVMK